MSLQPGTRLGPYEIHSAIGAGGMGEVYRARDTKLNRDVALKVLPHALALDADRVARFKREAQLLASLNHPNIAAIYGFEEYSDVASGFRRTTHALILELVEGPTLEDRVRQGPIPLEDALPIAREIAQALSAAHEHGVIHRDLKPANIKVRGDGTVKVLDFGLAKALEGDVVAADVSHSPTLTVAGTRMGTILGTAAYMSPEQAKGRPVDKRADIWAFGAVLYEMLTGKRAFAGDDVGDILAAVWRDEPDWSALPGDVTLPIRTLLRGCLEKNPRDRIGDISTAIFVLQHQVPFASGIGPAVPGPTARPRRIALVGVGTLLLGAFAAGATTWWFLRPAPSRLIRTAIPLTAASAVDDAFESLAITPDGSRVVYVGEGGTTLFVRSLASAESTSIASGKNLHYVFLSPDGKWAGFIEGDSIVKKVALGGGPSITVAERLGSPTDGAVWTTDDSIIFATEGASEGLQRVSAAGGDVTILAHASNERGEQAYVAPDVLPGGRQILFTISPRSGDFEAWQIAVLDLDTGKVTTVLRGGRAARYVPTGHLVYESSNGLYAVAFDVKRTAVTGTPVPVVVPLGTTQNFEASFSIAADGTLVYVDVPATSRDETMVWVDRTGREDPRVAKVPPSSDPYPRISPDGQHVAFYIGEPEQDLYIWDLARNTQSRFTTEPGRDWVPLWTPDGKRLIFASARANGVNNLFWQSADGIGAAERLTDSPNPQFPSGLSPDGTQLLFYETIPNMRRDLMQLTLSAKQVSPLLQTRFEERNAIVSPDGRWLAYESDSSGRFEIYVRPFPRVADGQWQVSTDGGVQPLWGPRDGELFYRDPAGGVMAISPGAGPRSWNAVAPGRLFPGPYKVGGAPFGRMYDIAPDGRRFLMVKESGKDQAAALPAQIIVVQNWLDELKRLVPAN